ncbi:PREDICTED: serine protease easter-like [Polistes dominula]|uniref:CLIP domain-containing serine protease n=1 Tax=Polistes dominula TaxID=743375 RepID=A0ABM1HT29_POLDO|nr:PREDICTED: serine protease easter-like [Polistes dominula]
MHLIFTAVATFYAAFFSIGTIQNSDSPNCTTLNGIAGHCIGIHQCTPLLKKLIEKPIYQEVIDNLKVSHCGFDGLVPLVCCPSKINSSNFNLNKPLVTTTETSISTLENVNNNDAIIKLLDNPLLPSDCGRDSTPRDLKSANTTLGEFPWLVLLEYDNGTNTKFQCAGALISKRYVLTAAKCLIERPPWVLSSVRLGVHDLHLSTNCVKGDDGNICSDGSISVEIEESFIHELFDIHLEINFNYDVGLVRLSKDIVSTYYIKPICLPKSSIINNELYIAGWSSTLENSSSNVKRKVSVQLFDKDLCQTIYGFGWNATVSFEQICAGGEIKRDGCIGDGGGPLMSFWNLPNGDKIWTAVGIESYGHEYCGSVGFPSIYTKVYNFIPWIISKMRP